MVQYADLASTVLRILIIADIASLVCLSAVDYFAFDIGHGIFNAAKWILFLMAVSLGAINGPKIFKLKR